MLMSTLWVVIMPAISRSTDWRTERAVATVKVWTVSSWATLWRAKSTAVNAVAGKTTTATRKAR